MIIRLNVLACAAALALCSAAQAQNVTVKSYSVSPSIKMMAETPLSLARNCL